MDELHPIMVLLHFGIVWAEQYRVLICGLCWQQKQSLYFKTVAHKQSKPSSCGEEFCLSFTFHPCNVHLSSHGCHATRILLQPYKGFQDAEAETSCDYLEGVVGKRHLMGGMFMENSSLCSASVASHMISTKHLREPTKPLETPWNLWASWHRSCRAWCLWQTH